MTPLNPFNLWGYFLDDLVDRDLVRRANNNVLALVDEVWVFGPIADGVWAEIEYAMKLHKPLKFFAAGPRMDLFQALSIDNLSFESELLRTLPEAELRRCIAAYLGQVSPE